MQMSQINCPSTKVPVYSSNVSLHRSRAKLIVISVLGFALNHHTIWLGMGIFEEAEELATCGNAHVTTWVK